jgi:predicted phage tail protein
MLRVVKVYGSLAKFLGAKSFKADVKSPAEAVQFLRANFPGLPAHMADKHYKVSVGRHELDAGDQPDQLGMPAPMSEPIRIVPVISGAGSVGRIIAGVALVAFAILAAPAGAGFLSLGQGAFGFTLGATASSLIGSIGVAMAFSGVSQLLTPTPTSATLSTQQDNPTDPRSSYSFSGIQNVARQGVPVPLAYGSVMTGSVVISAGINTEQV